MPEKKTSKNKRGKNPSALTVHMLCANSAGRCEFEGCNEYIFQDTVTLKKFNKSNVAHIVASSPDGPRGDEVRSYELSDKLENLMLMCKSHHTLIDDRAEEYPEEKLLEMKKKHEDRVRNLIDLMYTPETERVLFTSPIKGKDYTRIETQLTVDAVLPAYKPASTSAIIIDVRSSYDYKSEEYWLDLENQLTSRYQQRIQNALDFDPNTHFSVFPLAPIPLIIKLGHLFKDKSGIEVFQKTREPNTWSWIDQKATNIFKKEKIIRRKGNKIALLLDLTAEISLDRVTSILDADIIYAIKAKNIGVDSIKSTTDLSEFWHLYQAVCDEVKNIDNVDELSVFPAIPVSAAFEIGRRYMTAIYPKLRIYEDCDGFFETISIGGDKI